MLAGFGTPEIGICVVLILAIFGYIWDSRKTKRKMEENRIDDEKDYIKFKAQHELKVIELTRKITALEINLKEHIDKDSSDRKDLYLKIDKNNQAINDKLDAFILTFTKK